MTEGEKPRPCASGDKCPPRARPPDTDKEREISYWRWRLVCSWLRHSFTGWIEERWTITFRKLYWQTYYSFVPVEYSSVHLKNILNLPKIYLLHVWYVPVSCTRAGCKVCCGYGARLSDECGDTGERRCQCWQWSGWRCLQSWHVHNADNIAGTSTSSIVPHSVTVINRDP